MKQLFHHHKQDLIRIGATALALVLSLSGVWKIVEVFGAVRHRRMTMELSMSIAVSERLSERHNQRAGI